MNGSKFDRIERMIRSLFILNALIWLGLGISTLLNTSGSGPISPLLRTIIAALMAGNALAMGWIGLRLQVGRRWTYLLGLALLGVNILLTIIDEFGPLDFATLVIDVILLALLLVGRKLYLSVK